MARNSGEQYTTSYDYKENGTKKNEEENNLIMHTAEKTMTRNRGENIV